MQNVEELGVKLIAEGEGMTSDLVDWRRSLHQFPELGLEEHMTAAKIEGILSSLPGVEVIRGFGLPTCVIGVIGAAKDSGALAFRAEIDAVEVKEETGLPFSSYDHRVSHAQGHDAHIATLLGTAALLSNHRAGLRHPVVFIFQPAEEGKGGARFLIEAGLIERFNIERMLCVHWMPQLPYGVICTKRGGITSFSSKTHIGLYGQGGHGATPHLTSDPLFLAARLQIELQGMVTREINPEKAAVVSFGRIEAGDVYNVIAEETHLWGTVRCAEKETQRYMQNRIEELVKGMARLHHLAASVEYTLNYDQVINDETLVSNIFKVGTALIGSDAMELIPAPLLVGEDFSFYSQLVPSCLMFLGTGMEYGLYHARYDIPENLLPFAAAWGAYLGLTI